MASCIIMPVTVKDRFPLVSTVPYALTVAVVGISDCLPTIDTVEFGEEVELSLESLEFPELLDPPELLFIRVQWA